MEENVSDEMVFFISWKEQEFKPFVGLHKRESRKNKLVSSEKKHVWESV